MNRLKYFKLHPDITIKDIELQYRELAKKYHPDKQTEFSSKEKFQELQQEYQEVLKHFKQKAVNSGDINRAEQIAQLIDLLTEKFINDKYKPLAKEGLKLLFGNINKAE